MSGPLHAEDLEQDSDVAEGDDGARPQEVQGELVHVDVQWHVQVQELFSSATVAVVVLHHREPAKNGGGGAPTQTHRQSLKGRF